MGFAERRSNSFPDDVRPAIGVTVFQPSRYMIEPLADTFRSSECPVIFYVDGPVGVAIDADLLADLRARPWLQITVAEDNLGIGVALNALAEAAIESGATHLLTLDQDSSPTSDLPYRLAQACSSLKSNAEHPAAVGPYPVNPVGETGKLPRYFFREKAAAGCRAVDYIITSGALVDLSIFAEVGPFRSDYFIDGIDTEWCLRAWSKGFSIWVLEATELTHRIGDGVIAFGPLRFPRQSEARMLTYIRNRVAMLRLAHVPLRWKIRTLAYLPLQCLAYARERGAWSFIGVAAKATSDGWMGRFGKPAQAIVPLSSVQHDTATPDVTDERKALNVVELHGLLVHVDRCDDAPVIQRAIDRGWYEIDEVKIARTVIKPGDRVVELGAGMGIVTSIIASIVGDAAVVAYEPNPAVAARARANLTLNGHTVAVRERLCRPRSQGGASAPFSIAEVFWASKLDDKGALGETLNVPVDPLEAVLSDHRANVLVMDIEGGELEILQDADLSSLSAIIFETHQNSMGLAATNKAVMSACERGFFIDFSQTRDGVVVLRRNA